MYMFGVEIYPRCFKIKCQCSHAKHSPEYLIQIQRVKNHSPINKTRTASLHEYLMSWAHSQLPELLLEAKLWKHYDLAFTFEYPLLLFRLLKQFNHTYLITIEKS